MDGEAMAPEHAHDETPGPIIRGKHLAYAYIVAHFISDDVFWEELSFVVYSLEPC